MQPPRMLSQGKFLAAAALIIGFLIQSAPAQTWTWDGGAGSANWSLPLNWNTDTVPVNNGTANLVFAGSFQTATNADTAWNINSLAFGDTAGTFTLAGSQLTIRGGGISTSSANNQTINNAIALGAAQTWASAVSTLTLNGAVNNGGDLLTLDGSNQYGASASNGAISGGGGLTKSGSNVWNLTGATANTYTGLTTVQQGTLYLGKTIADGAIAGNVIVGDNTAAAGTATLAYVFNGVSQVANASNVTVNSSGVLDFNNTSETFANLTINGGTVQNLGTLNVNGTLVMTGGSILAYYSSGSNLYLHNDLTVNPSAGGAVITAAVNLGGSTRVFAVADGVAVNDLTVDGLITNGSVIKSGAGALRLGGINTFQGNLTLNDGTLSLANNQAAGVGTLVLNGGAVRIDSNYYTSVILANPVVLAGNVSLASSRDNYPLAFSGPTSLTGDRTLTITGGSASSNAVLFSGAIDDGGGRYSLTKLGNGTLQLAGVNTFSGALNINEGILKLGASSAFGAASSVNLAAGTIVDLNGLDINSRPLTLGAAAVINNSNVTSASFNGLITLNGAAIAKATAGAVTLGGDVSGNFGLTVDGNYNVTLNGKLNLGSGGLTKIGVGALILNGNNSYIGATTITAGTVKLGHPNALGDTTAGTAVASGATLDLNGLAIGAEPTSLSYVGFGAAPLINSNPNTASFAGAITLLTNAGVQAQAGNLTLNGSVTSSGFSFSVDGPFNTALSGPVSLGTGGLAKIGTGVLTLSATAAYTGSTSVQVGTLRLAAGGNLPSASAVSVSSGATIDLGGSNASLGSLTGAGSVLLSATNTLTVGGLNTSTTYSGILSGAGGLVKTGSGTLTLSGANTFTGGATISGGVLTVGNANALGTAASSVTVNSGALDLNGQTLPQALTLNGPGSGTYGALSNNSTAAASLSSAVTLGSASTIRTGSTGSLTLSGSITGNSTLTADSSTATITFSGPLSLGTGGLTKNGTGTLLLNGSQASAYTGTTTVNVGILELANTGGGAIPGDIIIGDKSGTDTVRLDLNSQIASTANVSILSSGVLDLNGASNSLASVAVTGGVITPGSGTLSAGALTFTGGSISAGTGAVAVANNLTLNASGTTVSFASAVNVGGQTVNQGSLSLTNTLTAGNGFLNNGTLAVALNAQLAANGSGLDNEGSLTFSGGTLTGSGPMVNNSAIAGFGTIGGTGGLTNNAQITQSGGSITLSNTGANNNLGIISLVASSQLRLTGGGLANSGTINLNGAVVAGTATLTNKVGGVINASGTITAPFANSGGSLLVTGGTLNVTQAFINSGIIQLGGGGSSLVGGQITSTGAIQGLGSIGNAVVNSGVIAPQGGGTLIAGGALQNAASGLVRVAAGNVLLASSGLSTNAGIISLTGGTFDNNGAALYNTGQISGYGTFATGSVGLSNAGTVTFTGGVTTVNGNVTNTSDGIVRVSYNPTIFTGNIVNNGLFKTTSTTTTFAGSFTNNGIFTSDPATQTFAHLNVTPNGALQGGEGDVFIINGDLTNYSAQAAIFDLSSAKVTLAGAGTHVLVWPGADLGSSDKGYDQNFAVGELELTADASLALTDGNAVSGGALYVFTLRLDGGTNQIQAIVGNGLNIYYDPTNPANAYLNNGTYSLNGGGMIAPVPEPRTIAPMALGAVFLLWALRRRARV